MKLTILSILNNHSVAIWCMTDPDYSRDKLVEFRGDVAKYFTWFYVGNNPAFMVSSSSFSL